MADRLQELLQQRALIREHLDWIEGEISAASGRPLAAATVAAPTAPPPELPTPPLPLAPRAAPAKIPAPAIGPPRARDENDALIARLAAAEEKPAVPKKWGCWIFFSVTMISLAGAAWLLLRYFYRE
ncbi:MAG: hypothetical protein ABIO94_04235 [Opitutaceae bacterium]